jgi:hypothetical protein
VTEEAGRVINTNMEGDDRHSRDRDYPASSEAQHVTSDTNTDLVSRLRSDRAWLAERDIVLTQWGPDHGSGKLKIYLSHYSDEAQQVLINRYGPDVVVSAESRSWSFGDRN